MGVRHAEVVCLLLMIVGESISGKACTCKNVSGVGLLVPVFTAIQATTLHLEILKQSVVGEIFDFLVLQD